MQSTQITSVSVEGLHASQDIQISLRAGLNIIHGRNGSGKTTLLHIIANLAERDLERFCHIKFKRVAVKTLNGAEIEIHQKSFGEKGIVELWVDKQSVGTVSQGEETPPAVNLVLKERLGGRPVYLPAFRSILEAASRSPIAYREEGRDKLMEKIYEREVNEIRLEQKERAGRWVTSSIHERPRITAHKTMLCREWFGAFVPVIRSPSLFDVSDEVQSELQQAQLELAATDREALSEVFFQALQAALSDAEAGEPVDDVQSLVSAVQQHLDRLKQSEVHGLDRESTLAPFIRLRDMLQSKTEQAPAVEARIRRILKVYETALRNRTAAQERAFQRIKTFEHSVNKFLQGKKLILAYEPRKRGRWETMGHSVVTLHDNRRHSFFVLSSGERHVLTLLFSATHMSPADGIVLIDEPELSLHVEWQRIILTELMKQAGDRQIIACTHSPEVAEEHRNVLVALQSGPVNPRKEHSSIEPNSLDVEQDEEA